MHLSIMNVYLRVGAFITLTLTLEVVISTLKIYLIREKFLDHFISVSVADTVFRWPIGYRREIMKREVRCTKFGPSRVMR